MDNGGAALWAQRCLNENKLLLDGCAVIWPSRRDKKTGLFWEGNGTSEEAVNPWNHSSGDCGDVHDYSVNSPGSEIGRRWPVPFQYEYSTMPFRLSEYNIVSVRLVPRTRPSSSWIGVGKEGLLDTINQPLTSCLPGRSNLAASEAPSLPS